MMKPLHNILIVRTDRMGDVVLTTPVIGALRAAYPKARLCMLVTPATWDLVAGHPDLDEVMLDDRAKRHKGFWGFWRLIRQLRRRNFSAAFIFHTKRRTNLMCFLAGIPHRIGYKNNKFGFLLTDPVKDTRHEGRQHEVDYCLDILKAWGLAPPKMALKVSLHGAAEQWAKDFFKQPALQDKRCIAIHPGASDPAKCWPAHRFAAMMNVLDQRHACVFVLMGAAATTVVAEQIKTDLEDHVMVWNLTGKTSVAQMVSILKRCQLLISNDSGPVHVAAGVGTPVVSLFTRDQPGINPERWRPFGHRSRVVRVDPEAVAQAGLEPSKNKNHFAKSGGQAPQYMELIPSQAVLEAVDAVFKE